MSKRNPRRHVVHRGMRNAPAVTETSLAKALGLPTIDDLRREALAREVAARNAEYEAFREARRQEALAAELRAKWADVAAAPAAPPAAEPDEARP